MLVPQENGILPSLNLESFTLHRNQALPATASSSLRLLHHKIHSERQCASGTIRPKVDRVALHSATRSPDVIFPFF